MRDIRKKLHRELLIRQAQPGVAVQNKVNLILQQRKRDIRSTRDNSQPTLNKYTPSVTPFTEQEEQVFLTSPNSRDIKPFGTRSRLRSTFQSMHQQQLAQHHHITQPEDIDTLRLNERLQREMTARGVDEISKQMMLSYIRENPKAIADMRNELRKDRQESRRVERSMKQDDHRHIYAEELLVSSHVTSFPKKCISQSDHELISTRTGNATGILSQTATSFEVSTERLEPIRMFHSALPYLSSSPASQVRLLAGAPMGPLSASIDLSSVAEEATVSDPSVESSAIFASTKGTNSNVHSHRPTTLSHSGVLGDHLPTFMCQGLIVTFDSSTIASLTTQGGAMTQAIIDQQEAETGPLLVEALDEEIIELHRANSPPPPEVQAKVQSGVRRKLSPIRKPSPSTLASDPSTSSFTLPILREEELQALRNKPLELVGDGARVDSGVTGKSPPTTSLNTQSHASVKLVDVPDGVLKSLLRSAEAENDNSDSEGFDPNCIVCLSTRKSRKGPKGVHNTDGALMRWRALHQLVQMDAQLGLSRKLHERDESSRTVSQNLRALAQVSRKANSHAEAWSRARCGSVSPSLKMCDARMIWDAPSTEIECARARWASCIVFWGRFRQFLALLQSPQTEAQEEVVAVLQRLMEHSKVLSCGVFLQWLHICGPQLCKVREYYRLVTYVRLTLDISLPSFQAWCKLPFVKEKGFDIMSD